jgi:hypothetical protein
MVCPSLGIWGSTIVVVVVAAVTVAVVVLPILAKISAGRQRQW